MFELSAVVELCVLAAGELAGSAARGIARGSGRFTTKRFRIVRSRRAVFLRSGRGDARLMAGMSGTAEPYWWRRTSS